MHQKIVEICAVFQKKSSKQADKQSDRQKWENFSLLQQR